ncbi:MAG: fibronectin type III domain-containing protein [Saprospiraceae bacterium]|nr:fibronectin type III domain-containing protein [Saprospiraceae bacterium]HMX86930.1 M12 family metallo-peptidase [Saprospiraceae bacterium]HMZ38962.1 M12 family metallo-peptidase [Saprospiraceae bacterium]HNA65591.1 M12 family metallo-peptidase [Saprospiraceae bacterium]HNB30962.1 M12 family metallo-peptidase [Saprospiraceae bacterium]
MTLNSSFARRIFTPLFFLLFIFSNYAQNNTEINVQAQAPRRASVLAEKVRDLKSSGINFASTVLLQPVSTDAQALKLFGVREGSSYIISSEGLQQISSTQPEALRFEIPMGTTSMVIDLVKTQLITEDFYTETSDGTRPSLKTGSYYQGVVSGNESSSVAAISFFESKILGMISIEGQNIILESVPDKAFSLFVYDDKKIIHTPEIGCGADLLDAVTHGGPSGPEMAAGDCIRVYIECDYALYQNKGSVQATVDWITSVFNNVKTLYTNESINTTLSEVYVWTSADPYSKTDSYTALTQFKTQRPTFNGDLAHLAALGGSNIGGIAWIDALCTSYKYAYSNIYSSYQDVPTYSWTIEVMTHEMGHNIGSNHTHWCGWTGGAIDNCYTPEGSCSPGPAPTNGGTIMSYCHLTSYGINFNNGFGPLPGDKIRSRVVAATCLGTSCSGGSCGTPGGLVISNITNTSAKASWNAVSGANSYDFEYKLSTAQTWTVVNVTVTNYTMSNLSAGTTYNTRVKAKCTGGNSSYSAQINFTTTGGSSCGTPTNFKVSNVTSNSANASWTAVTGALSYNFQYKLSTSQTWSQANVTVTSVNLTGLAPSTSYDVRVQAVCTSGNSAFTSTITFVTLASSYCTSKGNNSSFEWVSRVKIGTIDRTSGSDGGYYNGTNLIADVVKGTTYTLNYQAGSTGQSGTLYWKVWIDWNRNNSFNDAGEEVVSNATPSLSLLAANITVPAGASTGTTRMRVSVKYGGYPTSCQTFSYGEVEDYTLNIKASGSLSGPQGNGFSLESISLQPNPFNHLITAFVNAESDQEVTITVSDLMGRIQFVGKRNLRQGANALDVDLSELSAAAYVLSIASDKQNWQKKIIKQD